MTAISERSQTTCDATGLNENSLMWCKLTKTSKLPSMFCLIPLDYRTLSNALSNNSQSCVRHSCEKREKLSIELHSYVDGKSTVRQWNSSQFLNLHGSSIMTGSWMLLVVLAIVFFFNTWENKLQVNYSWKMKNHYCVQWPEFKMSPRSPGFGTQSVFSVEQKTFSWM